MTKLLKISALVVPACAMLALAQPATAADSVTSAAAAAAARLSTETSQPRAARDKIYCVKVIPDNGSRMVRRFCKTKGEWSDQGIDVDAEK